jgi:MoaA/NifB/PqqE/SkfB family radical SAM enzyme
MTSHVTQRDTDSDQLYHVMWRMNQRCNYKCAYCFREGVDEARWEEDPDCGKHSPEHISRCFDGTGKKWRIHMTGGEPLLYPRFVELAERLAARHELSVNTNLSIDSVREFGERVPVAGVYVVNATVHVAEIERRDGGMSGFIERAMLLQEKGMRVRVMYVSYPPLLGRMENDVKMLAAAGLRECTVKVFRGIYEGKSYPEAYSPDERALLGRQAMSRKERDILDERISFEGKRCTAGHTTFYMDIGGNLTRCCTIPSRHGNLFGGGYRFDDVPRICTAGVCVCPYQGMKFAESRQRLGDRAMAAVRRVGGAIKRRITPGRRGAIRG